jgi:hypothetical protein
MRDRILVLVIAVLALADGILHLALDIVLFRSRFFLNELSVLFLLNFVGYVVLAAAFLFGRRLLGSRAWLLNLVLAGYTVAAIAMWLQRGGPNPMGLGYASKALEVLLVVAVLMHWWAMRQTESGGRLDVATREPVGAGDGAARR